MNYSNLSLTELLTEIKNKNSAIINLGKQLHHISPQLFYFDLFLIASLNRTINISKAYTELIESNNFLSAAPLVRINLDTLLRLFASIICEYDRNTFAMKVMSGEKISNMNLWRTKIKLSDKTLYSELSKNEGYEWVVKIYKAGSSFIHLEKSHMFSSMQIKDLESRTIQMTIGYHDKFVPESEKMGSAVWMNKIVDSIIMQAQIWFDEKATSVEFDIEKLNHE